MFQDGFEDAAMSPYRDAVLALSPVGYWRLGETSGTVAVDETGNNNGTYVGGATLGQVGAISNDTDTAAGLDGSNDYINVDGYQGITGTGARTVSAWIKTVANTDVPIVAWGLNQAGERWSFRIDEDNGALRVESQGDRIIGTTDLTDPTNGPQWYNVAVTWADDGSPDISDAKLYVNGVLETISSDSANGVIINTAAGSDVRIGRAIADYYAASDVDEVAIFDSALTSTQIADLYNLGIEGNRAPTAMNDSAVVIQGGTTVIDVFANDTDPDAGDKNNFTVSAVTQGNNGTVTNNGSNVTYTPDAGFFGSDSFIYTVSDSSGATDTAAVSVTVNPANSMSTMVPRTASDAPNNAPIDWQSRIDNATGTTTTVTSPSEFNDATATAQPGDIILVKNGTRSWGNLRITSNGTEENPIIYTAETPGGVTFQNASTLFKVTGRWNIIGGFNINNIAKRVFLVSNSDNRLTGNTITASGIINFSEGAVEILGGGDRTRFDNNTVTRSKGYAIRVVLSSQNAPQDVRIDNNIFDRANRAFRVTSIEDHPGDAAAAHSGQSIGDIVSTPSHHTGSLIAAAILQVGQGDFKSEFYDGNQENPPSSALVHVEMRTVFEYNTIKNFNGRTSQIISNKSSYNTYRYNNFINAVGGIGLRQGNYNQVYGNSWKDGSGSSSIFFYGMYNVIANNIIDRPNGRGISEKTWGDRPHPTTGVITYYPPTGYNLVANNTIVATRSDQAAISLGFDNGESKPITGSIYVNNIIMGNASKLFAYKASGCDGCVITNNLFYPTGGATLGEGFAAGQNNSEGDPQLDSNYRPTAGSPVIDAGNPLFLDTSQVHSNFSGNSVNVDLDHSGSNNRLFGSAPDIGAFEYTGSALTATVGASGEGTETLTSAVLDQVVNGAIALWEETGIDASALAGVSFQIADLNGNLLGLATGNEVVLDINGAGNGWYIGSNLTSDPASWSQDEPNRIDLLSAVYHDLGHVLGLDHDSAGDEESPMQALLAPGESLLDDDFDQATWDAAFDE